MSRVNVTSSVVASWAETAGGSPTTATTAAPSDTCQPKVRHRPRVVLIILPPRAFPRRAPAARSPDRLQTLFLRSPHSGSPPGTNRNGPAAVTPAVAPRGYREASAASRSSARAPARIPSIE